ncbi:MAG: hypothetical protein L3K18_07685 [Thermoplasmata archaeon]|nr:hypothetical protein [Thermoplasmata archaeon]
MTSSRPWPVYAFMAMAIFLIAILIIEVVPLFFQSPHALHVCSKNGCTTLPASQYFDVLAAWSAGLLILAGFSSYLGLRIGRHQGRLRTSESGELLGKGPN